MQNIRHVFGLYCSLGTAELPQRYLWAEMSHDKNTWKCLVTLYTKRTQGAWKHRSRHPIQPAQSQQTWLPKSCLLTLVLHSSHLPDSHVGFVFLAVDDAQQCGVLLILKVQCDVVYGFDWKTNPWRCSSRLPHDSNHPCMWQSTLTDLFPSGIAVWWWSPWCAAVGGIWVWEDLYSQPPACWSGAFSL